MRDLDYNFSFHHSICIEYLLSAHHLPGSMICILNNTAINIFVHKAFFPPYHKIISLVVGWLGQRQSAFLRLDKNWLYCFPEGCSDFHPDLLWLMIEPVFLPLLGRPLSLLWRVIWLLSCHLYITVLSPQVAWVSCARWQNKASSWLFRCPTS